MKEFDKLEYFWMELFNAVIGILNMYIAFTFLLDYGVQSYFIAFWVGYGINCIILIFISIGRKIGFLFVLLDLLYLGWLNGSRYENCYSNQALVNFSSLKLIISLLINSIFFYGVGILSQSNLDYYHIYLCYSLTLFQMTFFAILVVLYCFEYSDLSKMVLFTNSITLNLTVFTLIQHEDPLGINLGYYQLVIFGISFIIILFIKISKQIEIFDDFYMYTFLNIIDHKFTQREGLLLIMSYISQSIRLIVLGIFAFRKLNKIFSNKSNTPYEITMCISLILVAIASVSYFIQNYAFIGESLFTKKTFFLTTPSDVKRLKQYMSKRHKYLKSLRITLDSSYPNNQNQQKQKNLTVNIIDQNEDKEGLDIQFQIYNTISNFYKFNGRVNVRVESLLNNLKQAYHLELAFQVENLHSNLLNSAITTKNIDLVVMKRIENGLFFNYSTHQLIRTFRHQIILVYQNWKSQILSAQIFQRNISNLMIFSSKQILYDLYEV